MLKSTVVPTFHSQIFSYRYVAHTCTLPYSCQTLFLLLQVLYNSRYFSCCFLAPASTSAYTIMTTQCMTNQNPIPL